MHMQALQDRISYQFHSIELLNLAMAHPSLAQKRSNQRLEFLGDSVLGLAVATLLYELYPTENEGELARRHAALVCGPTLVEIAKQLELGNYLFLGDSEENAGGRKNVTNLEDACEALVGALYLDGGFPAADRFIRSYWTALAKSVSEPPKDAKTALQEWTQARALGTPEYVVINADGPAHAPIFTIEVRVKGHTPVNAEGTSKRAAEQGAAEKILKQLVGDVYD